MALLPSIPTSFVPHPGAGGSPARPRPESNAFAYLAYGLLLVVFVIAVGVFAYGALLKNQQAGKDAQLQSAEQKIDKATVEGFIRLRDRLTMSKQELGAHVAFSNFFNALEAILPSTVRFTNIHLSIDPTGTVGLEGAGVAKSFNALASLSNAMAQDGRIKNAIFSKLTVKSDNTVTFGLSATLDPKLVAFNATASPMPPSIAPTGSASSSVQMVNPSQQH